MSWLPSVDAATAFEAVLGQRPALLERFRPFYASLWNEQRVPARVLELCRQRIAAIHDCPAEMLLRDARVALDETTRAALRVGDIARFAAAEQAALTLAERMPFDHHGIDDGMVAAAREHFGDAGTVSLLTALAFFDVVARLKIVFAVPALPRELAPPPCHDGALA